MIKGLKRSLALGLTGVMIAGALAGCGDKKTNSTVNYKKLSGKNDTVYRVALLASNNTTRALTVQQGFRDALTDTLGEGHFELDIQVPDDTATFGALASKIVNAGSSDEEAEVTGDRTKKDTSYDLFAADGLAALTAAADSTTSLPIVGMDVLSYKDALHLTTDRWNDPTGRNVTGISNKVPLADYVSLVIEGTKNVRAVGLLYNPEDTDAITQNEVIEKYLTEAGIPWKEYELQATDTVKNAGAASYGSLATPIYPGKQVAPDSVTGPYPTPDVLGTDSDLQGLNDSISARAAKQSDNWIGGKYANTVNAHPELAGTESTATETTSTTPAATNLPNQEISSDPAEALKAANSTIIKTATDECSALVLAPNSQLGDQGALIASIANENHVTTIAGDAEFGEYATATLYLDPYAIGYAAGQQAYRILENHEDPSEMTLESAPGASAVKLYNQASVDALGLRFGKTFFEYRLYMAEHPSGSSTQRVNQEEKQ